MRQAIYQQYDRGRTSVSINKAQIPARTKQEIEGEGERENFGTNIFLYGGVVLRRATLKIRKSREREGKILTKDSSAPSGDQDVEATLVEM